jgi:hypothetical protein
VKNRIQSGRDLTIIGEGAGEEEEEEDEGGERTRDSLLGVLHILPSTTALKGENDA